jgi:hypothetical protein
MLYHYDLSDRTTVPAHFPVSSVLFLSPTINLYVPENNGVSLTTLKYGGVIICNSAALSRPFVLSLVTLMK